MKPDNICIGDFNDLKTLHSIRLIDFGLATPYLETHISTDGTEERVHIPKAHKCFQGNLAFSSKNCFKEVTLSRRDDLISLAYFLLYLATGKLPFVKHNLPLMDQINRIKRKKNKQKPKKFCGAYKCDYLIEFTEYTYSLRFEDEPDYNYLKFLLKKNLMDKEMV